MVALVLSLLPLVALSPPRWVDVRCTRAALLQTSLLGSSLLLAAPPQRALAADDTVMQGVLQMEANLVKKLPAGSTATVTLRVVGRNTKGPLAEVQLPLDDKVFPVEYTISKESMREGVPDFIWETEDIYIKADVTTAAGKDFAAGRSKAKAVNVDGRPSHNVAYLSLE